MGLNLSVTEPTGVKIGYWKITKVSGQYDRDEPGGIRSSLSVGMDGYLSKAGKDGGAKPVKTVWIAVPEDAPIPDGAKALRQVLYAAVKTHEAWTKATDVLEAGQ